uniref:Protein kinase domain-containing protein n=1 Tax=Leersia perrieri TaxID=77586 RepID=A0A0D9UWH6_9ORYZ
MHPTLLILPFLASLLLPFCHAECEPSTCGDITVRYPFWLGGPNLSRSSSSSSSPAASCGHPAFEVWCTSGVASLRGSQILVLTIDYTNSSFIAAHKRVADGGDGVCRTDFNISSSLALSPFTISGRNRAICFLYGCSNGSTVRITEPGIVNATSVCTRPIYAHLGGSYDRDRPPAIETTGNCTFSYLPVLWPDAPASLTPGVNYSPSKSPLGFQCILLLPTLSLILSAATAAEAQACKVGTCGDMRILEPFGLVTDQADNTSCRWYGFQVTCNNSIPYLGYYRRNQPFRFRIVDIFYNNNSLLVIDTHKTDDFTNASDCHVPSVNTSYKIGLPFSINDVNQKLVFYNCSKALAPAERSELGLFETKCRNNTFARLVGRYDDDESGYALDSCYAVIVPVLGREGKAKVSNYEKLISGGFLLSWQPPHQPVLMLTTAAKGAEEEGARGGCPDSRRCGNLTISSPFWITQSQTDRPCGALDFQVDCNYSTGIATLRSSSDFGFEILHISYGERALLAFDYHKLLGLRNNTDCRLPGWNTSAKLALPFKISPANLNLILYNCATAPAPERREQLGLVETRCRNNTFARLGERYDNQSSNEEYNLEGCSPAFLPVFDKPGSEANASSYEDLISHGFLITWELPVPPGLQQSGKFTLAETTRIKLFYHSMPPPPLFLLFAYLVLAAADTRPDQEDCPASTVCGKVIISKPFAVMPEQATENRCGWSIGFQVICHNNTPYLGYYQSSHQIQIIDIFYDNTSLLVSDIHKLGDSSGRRRSDPCHVPTVNTSSKIGLPFSISSTNLNLFLYNCNNNKTRGRDDVEMRCSSSNRTFGRVGGRYYGGDYAAFYLQGCNATVVPVLGTGTRSYERLIRDGFLLTWQQPLPSSGTKMKTTTKLAIGLGAGGGTFMIIFIFILAWNKFKKRKQSRDLKDLMRSTSSMQSYSKDLELGGSPHIFTYEELEEATAGFSASRELGDGGFGTVYKGKLRDGRVVAVKRLYKNNYRRVEQFLNELQTIFTDLVQQNKASHGL